MITVDMYIPKGNANSFLESLEKQSTQRDFDRRYAEKNHDHNPCGGLSFTRSPLRKGVSCNGHTHTYADMEFQIRIPQSAYKQNQVELFKTLISKCKVNFNRTLSCEID